ncbi:hypothetical protein C8Q73DRAFT_69641 [Cubamyces lactineus]|nr:hypothetical protein C8Q73DRAFT_69641 [Cubamyces lactineus]
MTGYAPFNACAHAHARYLVPAPQIRHEIRRARGDNWHDGCEHRPLLSLRLPEAGVRLVRLQMRSDELYLQGGTTLPVESSRRRGQGSRPGAQACAHRSSGEVVPVRVVLLLSSPSAASLATGFSSSSRPHPTASSYVRAGVPRPSPRRNCKKSVSAAYDPCQQLHSASPTNALASASASASRPRTSLLGIWRASNRIDTIPPSRHRHRHPTALHRAHTQPCILSRATVRHGLAHGHLPINRVAPMLSCLVQTYAPDRHRCLRPIRIVLDRRSSAAWELETYAIANPSQRPVLVPAAPASALLPACARDWSLFPPREGTIAAPAAQSTQHQCPCLTLQLRTASRRRNPTLTQRHCANAKGSTSCQH